MNRINFFLPLLLIILMSSCASQIKGAVSVDSSAFFLADISLGQRISALIRSFKSAAGQTNEIILDSHKLSQSMSAEGVSSVSLFNIGPAAVRGDVRIIDINKFFSSKNSGKFIEFNRNGSCKITLDLNNGPDFLENLSPEISDYLNALMAPVATGEKLTKLEYLGIVSTFYNKAISDEIANSKITASIEFPGVITSIKGGTSSGKTAEFNISLLDIMVLETPLIYEVNWR